MWKDQVEEDVEGSGLGGCGKEEVEEDRKGGG